MGALRPADLPPPALRGGEPWYSLHDRADQTAPIAHDPERRPGYVAAIHDTYGLGRLDSDDWAEIRATYAGMVSRVDHHLGRILAAVDRLGVHERTAALFFPDHGEYLGDHGLVEKWIAGLEPALMLDWLMTTADAVPSDDDPRFDATGAIGT